MAKLPPIRIKKRDEEEYRRLRRNTKAKINRVKKNYGVDLEGEIPLPDLSEFETRQEFNEWKELQQRFTNRSVSEFQFVKNPYGVVTTKKDIYQIEQATRQAQRLADEKIKEVLDQPTFHDGEQIGTVGDRAHYMKEPDVTGIHRPSDFDFSQVRSKRRLDDLREGMEKRSKEEYYDERNKRMLDNFINILEGSFHSEADDLIEELKTINPDDFYGLYQSNFTVFDFNLYDSEGQMVNADLSHVEGMMGVVEKFKSSDYYNG